VIRRALLCGAMLGVAAVGSPTRAQSSSAQVAVESARRALDRGERLEAARHAQAALVLDPANADAVDVLLRACGEDADARNLWSHELAAGLADARGKFKLSRELAGRTTPKDPALIALPAARAAAVAELTEFAARCRKEADKELDRVAWAPWVEELARQAAFASPALIASEAPVGVLTPPVSVAAQRATVESLSRRLGSAQASGDVAGTIEAALILRGLAAQAAFEDLEGPPPAAPIDSAADSASQALTRVRAEYVRAHEPLSIETLESMDGDRSSHRPAPLVRAPHARAPGEPALAES